MGDCHNENEGDAEGDLESELAWVYCPWCGDKFVETSESCNSCNRVRFTSKKILKKPPWQKILYAKQPYQDNYFDDELFLQGLRRNTNVVDYEYLEVVQDSSVVTLQISTVALFCLSVEYVYSSRLSLISLISLGFLFTTIGFIGRLLFITTPQKPVKTTKVLSEIKLLVLIFISAWILSPLLHTLTQPFSDDTILALSVFLFTIHLFTQDYSYMSGLSKIFTAPVSLNAAIFGSVLLVSRLPSFLDVYSVVCVSIELFALFPIFRRALKVYSDRWNLIVTWCMNAATAVLLFQVSTVVTLIYILSILFITFVCPYWLKRIQRYKNTIQGPWDEAVPTRNQPHFKL